MTQSRQRFISCTYDGPGRLNQIRRHLSSTRTHRDSGLWCFCLTHDFQSCHLFSWGAGPQISLKQAAHITPAPTPLGSLSSQGNTSLWRKLSHWVQGEQPHPGCSSYHLSRDFSGKLAVSNRVIKRGSETTQTKRFAVFIPRLMELWML